MYNIYNIYTHVYTRICMHMYMHICTHTHTHRGSVSLQNPDFSSSHLAIIYSKHCLGGSLIAMVVEGGSVANNPSKLLQYPIECSLDD